MGKLWAKGYQLDELIEDFTVGEDYLLDSRLIVADCLGSIAHATMLAEVGLLDRTQADGIVSGLKAIVGEYEAGRFVVARGDEDGHTAIENALVTSLGDAGKRVHTGRSRNDQVLLALRLFEREFLTAAVEALLELVDGLVGFAERYQSVPMVGRTHMQPAMPSSVGLWAGAWAEELLVDAGLLENALSVVDRSPLGSAASYGTSLPLNRERVAELLGFRGLLTNVLWANNSRGKIESIILDGLDQVGLTLSKMAQDLIMFSLPEFGYFSLPDELCTGSSIMPQKRNPDGLELIRGKAGSLSGYAQQVKNIIRSLPSGYNRDFQETKAPLFRGMDTALASVRVMALTIEKVVVNEDRLRAGFSSDVFATDAAYELVSQGMPFRDAYRAVASHLEGVALPDPESALAKRTSTGTPGNLSLDGARQDAVNMRSRIENVAARAQTAVSKLLGRETAVYR